MYHLPRSSYLSGIPMLFIGTLGYPFVAAAQYRGPWEMPMMQGGWGIVMMLLMLLFWAALVVVIIVGIRWLITSNRSERHMTSEGEAPSALDILKKRYARGEIGKKEFEEIRRDIE
jgi:putative membrane protein